MLTGSPTGKTRKRVPWSSIDLTSSFWMTAGAAKALIRLMRSVVTWCIPKTDVSMTLKAKGGASVTAAPVDLLPPSASNSPKPVSGGKENVAPSFITAVTQSTFSLVMSLARLPAFPEGR